MASVRGCSPSPWARGPDGHRGHIIVVTMSVGEVGFMFRGFRVPQAVPATKAVELFRGGCRLRQRPQDHDHELAACLKPSRKRCTERPTSECLCGYFTPPLSEECHSELVVRKPG
ncbi:unnamed protein product [Scytosiphon promiscuus]